MFIITFQYELLLDFVFQFFYFDKEKKDPTLKGGQFFYFYKEKKDPTLKGGQFFYFNKEKKE
jgi:hypothetical protein